MQKGIITQLRTALDETLELLSGFTEADLNKIPYEGSWTAAQVCRHLEKSQTGMDKLLHTSTEASGRSADEKAEGLREMFLNFETKMKSPDFILPEDRHYTHEELRVPLRDIRNKTLNALETAHLEQFAPLPKGHPFYGLTKLEMVHFMAYHTTRHNHQLKKIRDAVK
jgi:hypothetical protein